MKKQYVSLNLENISKVPVLQNRASSTRSIRRHWRQLSRLQKNIVICIAFLIVLFILMSYVFNYEDHAVEIQREFLEQALKPSKVQNVQQEINQAPSKEKSVESESRNNRFLIPNAVEQQSVFLESKEFINELGDPADAFTARQRAVINSVKHAWKGYKTYAWGHDHLRPISMTYQDWFHLSLTLVDSLDTLYLMNLKDEFKEARNWIETNLSFDNYSGDVNLFEVTIRVLGGLLSAFNFSKDSLFLEKAVDLGERLLPCFMKSPTPIPFSDVNLATKLAHAPKWSPDSSTAEVTTLQLEFRELSRSTGDLKFENLAFNVSKHVHSLKKPDGLVPIFINPNSGNFNFDSDIKLGARGDSYYEYLLKQWIQTGKTIDFLRDDYIEAIDGISRRLVKTTPNRKLVFIGELKPRSQLFSPKMDHLICYLPGTLALGVHNGMPQEHMHLAEQLIETCYRMYTDQPTGLAPEISYFSYENGSKFPDMYVHQQDAHNLLRPEFVESLWSLYQITGNVTYQSWGWNVFQAIERYSKVAHGYTSINNVLNENDTRPRDMMESFFISETLKYLFLLFSNDRHFLDMDKYIMNSEGHPLPIYKN